MTEVKIVDCCGCGLCETVCPINAIERTYDELGSIHYYPGKNCIHCGKCFKVCPIKNKVTFEESNVFYKARSINSQIMRSSSSGGIAYELAHYVINCGGVVYGATWNSQNQRVEHCRVDNCENLVCLQGSKYVQSFIGTDIYKGILEDIKQRQVLFIGSPCQVSAVRNYTNASSNLLTVDLVCHGVPSATLFSEQIKLMTKNRVDNVSFRDGFSFRLKLWSGDKTIEEDGLDNPYYSMFLHFSSLRESCYVCPYANRARCGDLTIGDYNENGTRYSLVVQNTEQGRDLIENTRQQIEYADAEQDIVYSNHAFIKPTIRPKEASVFRNMYSRYGLDGAYKRIYRLLIVKRKLRKLLGDKLYYSILTALKHR